MKKGQILNSISPHKFEEARNSVRIVKPVSGLKALEFRNNLEYNSGRINCFSARFSKKGK